MQVLCTFGIKMLFFLSICRFWGFSVSKCLFSLSICRFEGLQVHKTCIYSKKIKVLIVKSHQTYIYSKKIKTSQTLCCIDELVFDFLDSFEYMQVLCALLASKC